MFIEREMRQKLSELSNELWRRPNYWRKMLEQGFNEPVEGDKLSVNDVPHRRNRGLTPETLLTYMLDLKKKIESFKEEQKRLADANTTGDSK